MTPWPTLTQVPGHKQSSQCPVPARTKLGRENVSKLGKRLWAWLMSTGRPRAHHFSLPGSTHLPEPEKHPGSAWATGGLRCQLPDI